MVWIASLIICFGVVVGGMTLFSSTAAGLPSASQSTLFVKLAAAGAIYTGIISSLLFDRIDKRLADQPLFSGTDLVFASIISPIVFLAFYPLMQDTQDQIIQVLLAYQNGFCFQSIVARLRSGTKA